MRVVSRIVIKSFFIIMLLAVFIGIYSNSTVYAVEDVDIFNETELNIDEESISANEVDTVSVNEEACISNDILNISDSVNIPDEAESEEINDNRVVNNNNFDENIANVEAAFERIVEYKQLMALIYLTDECNVYVSPEGCLSDDSAIVTTLSSGHTVFPCEVKLISVNKTNEYRIMYKISFYKDGEELRGYVDGSYLAYSDEEWLNWENDYLEEYKLVDEAGEDISPLGSSSMVFSSEDVSKFPASYQGRLNALKASHPNWIFVPLNTGLDFSSAVNNEVGDKSFISNTSDNASKGYVGKSTGQGSWCYATKEAITYYMDPRNFLSESGIFQFEQLTYNKSYHTEAAVQNFLNNTFMKGKIPGDSRTYANAFVSIGASRGLSPTHLASRVYQEQGQGTSPLISGSYSGYEGYYNYFNVGASGSTTKDVIVSGLKYAKNQGWNTRYKSLEGGAATIGNGYILKGQDTIYLEKFNVNPNAYNSVYTHQYMQNIQAPYSEAQTTKKIYSEAGSLNSPFVFKIPVFENMPGSLSLSKSSATIKLNEEITLNVIDYGTKISGTKVTWSSSDTKIATVSNGVVKAVGIGENNEKGHATITAKYNGVTLSCSITVVNPISELQISESEITLRRSDTVVEDTKGFSDSEKADNTSTKIMSVKIVPENTTDNTTITYSTSNKKVATVDSYGVISAVGKGTATITATASKSSESKKPSVKLKVTVIAPIYKLELKPVECNSTDFDADGIGNKSNVIYVGQNAGLMYEYWPKDTSDEPDVSFTSSKPSIATVNKGKVIGVGTGSSVITASVTHYSSKIELDVRQCSVCFYGKNNTSLLKKCNVSYADTLPEMLTDSKRNYPDEEMLNLEENEVFIGWYTKPNGEGAEFNENFIVRNEETKVYPYIEKKGKSFYVFPIGDKEYTGSAIKPAVVVYETREGNEGTILTRLVKGSDYTVSYKNNKNVSTKTDAVAIVKGKGNYSGTVSVSFSIVPKSLVDNDISVEDINLAYNKKIQKGTPKVLRNGVKLKNGVDYKISYPLTGTGAYKNPGRWPVKITGKGGYTGSIIVYEVITNKILASKLSISVHSVNYDKDAIDYDLNKGCQPDVTVKYKGRILTESKDGINGDYFLTYKDNTAVGTGKVIVNACENSDFAGTKTANFKIKGTSLSKATITGISNKIFTGKREDVMQSDYSLYYSQLLKGISKEDYDSLSKKAALEYDYVVTYKNIDKKGTATIIFSGVNGYTGTVKKTYKINAASITEADIKYYTEAEAKAAGITINKTGIGVEEAVAVSKGINVIKLTKDDMIYDTYVSGGSRPQFIIYVNGIQLKSSDVSISYINNNRISDVTAGKYATATIKGKGNYSGKLTTTINISVSDIGSKLFSVQAQDIVYKNKSGFYESSPVVKDVNGASLKAGRDYGKSIEYSYVSADAGVLDKKGNECVRLPGDAVEKTDIPGAGCIIRATVKGEGNYTGSAYADYIISRVNLNTSLIKVIVNSKTYLEGRSVTLLPEDVRVMYGDYELVHGVDYYIDEATYSNNINKGKASVYIRAVNGNNVNFGSSRKISFNIKAKTIFK